MIKLVIFDIDGTIVNAYGAITNSLNFTLRKLGYSETTDLKARRAVGQGDVDFINRFFKKEDAPEAIPIYRRHHETALLRYSRRIPGAGKLLKCLKLNGYKLAIVSNRPGKFSRILLRHLDLMKYFDIISCAKNEAERKPEPLLILDILKRLEIKKSEAVYVGDMVVDVRAGNAAGVRTVAVLGGSSSRGELLKAKPSMIIRELSVLSAKLCGENKEIQ